MIIKDELKAMVGRQLNVKMLEEELPLKNGDSYKLKRLKFEDGVIDGLKKEIEALGYEKVRIMYYGGVYTQDIRMDRLCVKVDDTGVITAIYCG